MTNYDRRETRKRRKQLRDGIAASSDTTPANADSSNDMPTSAKGAAQPRREGLRNVKYAYYPDRAPVPVVPHKNVSNSRNASGGRVGGKVNSIFYCMLTNSFSVL